MRLPDTAHEASLRGETNIIDTHMYYRRRYHPRSVNDLKSPDQLPLVMCLGGHCQSTSACTVSRRLRSHPCLVLLLNC
jgi:hypothetical protein